MAVDLTVQDQLALMVAGSEPTMTAASGTGHTATNPAGAEVELWVDNASGSNVTLTMKTKRRSNFGTFPDKTVTILAGALVVLPTFAAQRFTDPATGKLEFTLSVTTNISVAAVRPGQYFQET